MATHIVFSHGKESGPWGSKIKSMAEHAKNHGEIHSVDYQDLISPDDRAERLVKHLESLNGDIILVGSSMGGYVSTVASSQVDVAGLMLLAPAFYLDGYGIQEPVTACKHVSIVHGWGDDVVAYENSVRFGLQHKAELKLVNDGHRLANSQTLLNSTLIALLAKVF
jgi:predicted alpha/beta hydrolase family esterase